MLKSRSEPATADATEGEGATDVAPHGSLGPAVGVADAIVRVEWPAADACRSPAPGDFSARVQRGLGISSMPDGTFERAVEWVLAHQQKVRFELALPGGTRVDALLVPEYDAAGTVRALLVSTHDITAQTRSEQKTRHRNVVLNALRSIHQHLVQERDPQRMIEHACKVLVQIDGYYGVWIVLTNPDSVPVASASAGFAEDAFAGLLRRLEQGPGPGCCTRAQAQAQPVTTENTPQTCPDCPLARAYTESTGVTVALRHEDRCFGYVAFSLSSKHARNEEEHALLATIAGDIAFTLFAIEAENAGQTQKDLMDKILSASSVGLAQAVDRKIIWANEAMEGMFGVRKQDYVGQDTRILYPTDEEYLRVGRLVYEQVAAHQPIQFDAEFVRSGGEHFFGHVKMNFLDAADRSKGMITSIIDITDRQRAEAALRASEEKYRTYVENAPGAIFVADEAGCYTDVNDGACRLTGYAREELLTMSIQALASASAVPEVVASFAEVKATGRSRRDIVIQRKDGSPVHASLDAVALADGLYLAFCGDLTERRHAAAEKAKLEEQLRQAQKMEAVGRLAGGVAHDFNNILTGINGYAEMILHTMDRESPLWSDVGEIHAAGQRAAALVDQLLAFSRKQAAAPKVVQANDVIERLQRMLRRLIGEDVDLVFNPAAEVGRIVIDPVQLEQILVNLAVNARDAMSKGGQLTIETANVSLDHEQIAIDDRAEQIAGDYVLLTVSDNGSGMDPETLARIFEPFFSARQSGRGTGLGLSTVWGIVRQNGGFIRVESAPAQGTTFRVYFPRTEAAVDVHEAEPVVPLTASQGTILVAEDEDVVRRLAVRVLRRQGYSVLEAENGTAALRVCEEQRGVVDLLLTDVVMPGLNGKELFDALRSTNPALQVLYMSGHSEDIITHHGVPEPGLTLIQKPFTVKTLSERVRRVLKR